MSKETRSPGPRGWTKVGFMQSMKLCAQLNREVVKGHALHRVRIVNALLSSDAGDDVLFEIRHESTPYVVAHLQWSRGGDGPGVQFYPDFESFVRGEEEEALVRDMLAAEAGDPPDWATAECPACGATAGIRLRGDVN